MRPEKPMPLENTQHAPQKRGVSPALVAAVGLLFLAVLFLVGVLPRMKRQTALAAESHDNASNVVPVIVQKPKSVLGGGIDLPGSVEPVHTAVISARAAGYLDKLYADIGSKVQPGQVLAILSSPDTDQQAVQANAQTLQALATVGQAQAAVTSLKADLAGAKAKLAQQGAAVQQAIAQQAGTRARLSEAQDAEAQAEASLSQTKAAEQQQQANLVSLKAQQNLATVTNSRNQTLLKQGFISAQSADQTAAALQSAAAGVAAGEAQVRARAQTVQVATHAVASSKAAVMAAESDIKAGLDNIASAKATYVAAQTAVQAAQATLLSGSKAVQANQAAEAAGQANALRYNVLQGFEKITAPFSGTITSRTADLGTLVTTGSSGGSSQALFTIADDTVMRVQVQVPQADIGAVQQGSLAHITVRELPGRVFTGKVNLLSGLLSADTLTQLVEVQIPNPAHVLTPGMFAEVHIQPSNPVTHLEVPEIALVINGKGTRVASVTPDSKVHFLDITIAKDLGNSVEVSQGITPQTRLILNPPDTLQEGQKVKVLAPPPSQGQ